MLPAHCGELRSAHVCVRVFSCFLDTEKMTGLNLEQIKVYEVHVRAKRFECRAYSFIELKVDQQVDR